MKFKDTTATQRVFGLKQRIRAVAGGTSASKTISILIWCIKYAQQDNHKDELISIVSESYPHLQKGAMLDFKNIMQGHGYWNDDDWHDTKHVYTFPATGVKIEFLAIDSYGKAHGPRRDVLFVNECNNLAYNLVDQLITRTRKIVWLDWNPSSEFWFYTDMLPSRSDVDFITLTYLDNEALDPITVQEIESHRNNKMWWTVYGEGKLGEIASRIYTGWQVIDEIPHEARLVRYGLDFGYTQDPTAIEAIYYYNGGYIIDEIAYQKGLSNKSIADMLLNLDKAMVIADGAEPKSVDEIRLYGVNIFQSQKGAGSVLQGIQNVQSQRVSITARSTHTIKAYRNYMFVTDRNGHVINTPDDSVHEWSNSMDAVRYGFEGISVISVQEPLIVVGESMGLGGIMIPDYDL